MFPEIARLMLLGLVVLFLLFLFVIGPLAITMTVKRKIAWLACLSVVWLMFALPFIFPGPGAGLCFPAAIFCLFGLIAMGQAFGDADVFAGKNLSTDNVIVVYSRWSKTDHSREDTAQLLLPKINICEGQEVGIAVIGSFTITLCGALLDAWEKIADGGGKLVLYHSCETEQMLNSVSIICGLKDFFIGGRLTEHKLLCDKAGPSRSVDYLYAY